MNYKEAVEQSEMLILKCEVCGSENLSRRPYPASGPEKRQLSTGPWVFLRVECEDCKIESKPCFLGEFQYH